MSKDSRELKFPDDFMWGASTSSHQVEGGTYNQWTVWELENANLSSKTAEQRIGWLPKWPDIAKQASDPNNYVSGEGIDHYNRYKHDLDIAKALNLNAFRFSVEWSRIEPKEGKWDDEAIDHYRTYIKEIKKRGMEPVLNLWHWSNPVWFEEKGAFELYANKKYFLRYAATLIEELGEDLKYVIIINEPNMYAWFSYVDGLWPPGKKSWFSFFRVYATLVATHRQTYRLIKDRAPHLQMSSSPQLVINVPKDPSNYWHRFCTWTANMSNNWIWQYLTYGRYDFIGFNNYFKNYITGLGPKGITNPKTPTNDMGWYMEPGGIGEMALAIHRKYPRMPILITENGVADSEDKHRQWWIEETLKSIHDARSKGADIIGYFHWSLLDNFEWAEGWWPKFGLVEVDRSKDMKRSVRPSAKWFADQIKNSRARNGK